MGKARQWLRSRARKSPPSKNQTRRRAAHTTKQQLQAPSFNTQSAQPAPEKLLHTRISPSTLDTKASDEESQKQQEDAEQTEKGEVQRDEKPKGLPSEFIASVREGVREPTAVEEEREQQRPSLEEMLQRFSSFQPMPESREAEEQRVTYVAGLAKGYESSYYQTAAVRNPEEPAKPAWERRPSWEAGQTSASGREEYSVASGALQRVDETVHAQVARRATKKLSDYVGRSASENER